MKSLRFGVTALLLFLTLFLTIQSFSQAWAQTGANLPGPQQTRSMQPAPVIIVSPPLTNFERVASGADQPLLHLVFPVVSVDFEPHISLTLTPRALTSFEAPSMLSALAVEFHISQSLPASHATEFSQSHSVATVLDFDELQVFRRIFNTLAATGFPHSQFSDAKAVVRMASKSGMRLEFAADSNGRIRCMIRNDIDSVTLSLARISHT